MATINEGTTASRHHIYWGCWATVAAFGTYFCMYAFRKPFTAATFGDPASASVSLKSTFVTAQVLGYMLSKFIGIKVVAEMPPHRRVVMIAALIGSAELALVLFGLAPWPWNVVCMFANGLPLGMVFGLVLGFLEGRRLTEALAAGLCASFIVADGAAKSAGAWLLSLGVTEAWMPSLAGAMFLVPLSLCLWMLSRLPQPDHADQTARHARRPMLAADRWSLFQRYALGLSLLVSMYLALTILRSLRADFAPELWQSLGAAAPPAIYTTSELLVAVGVTLANGATFLVRDHRRAFAVALGTCALGFLLIAVATILQPRGGISPFGFMVLVGMGLYLPYVAIHTTVFERLLAMTRAHGNVGYLMYLADSFGYLGYVAVLLAKDFIVPRDRLLPFFAAACWMTCLLSWGCLVISWNYFARRAPRSLPQVALDSAT